MDGYKMIRDSDMKVAKKIIPKMKIDFDNDLSIMGEVKIKTLRKYQHNYITGYLSYTCDVDFKGELVYSGNRKYGTPFYNSTFRGNKIRLNKRFKRLALNAIVNELKLLGFKDVNRLEIKKINWV
jgi:hypothetical protein